MSQRLGMADGRCTTIFQSGRLFNDSIYEKLEILPQDNLSYRRALQKTSPEEIIPAPTCSLYSYKDSSDIRDSTNVISRFFGLSKTDNN